MFVSPTISNFCTSSLALKLIPFLVAISGHAVNYPQPQVGYNASKASLLSMKSSLAAEWSRYGIRINTISPGYMDTVLNEGDRLDEAKKIWFERNPMGRMGRKEELSGALVLLCSGAGSYITGSDIVVDGEFLVVMDCVMIFTDDF